MSDKKDPVGKILDRLRPAAPSVAVAPVDDEESDALAFAEMNGRYSSMRPANKLLTRMHVVKKDGAVFTFQFAFLDARSTFDGNSFKLLFVGAKMWEVTVIGRGKGFWRLYDLITLHRWAYLMEATGSMPGAVEDGETVLTEIKIIDVSPRERE
jgi:hypothetical protein